MTDTEIDALSMAARNVQNKVGEQALWRAAVTLPEWYFVSQGSAEDAEPMVARMGGKPKLLAFTSEERAEAFVRHLQARPGGGGNINGGVLNMGVPDAVEYCQQLFDSGVDTIHFNPGDYEFSSGMIALKDRLSRYSK